MTDTYRVRVQKDTMIFSAAHFITFDGEHCERLHGHNYRTWAEVEGPLDENSYVIDFIFLRDTMQQIVFELDHQVLLPAEHKKIKVVENATEREVVATFEDRRWVFPTEDCKILPIANTTTELLASYILQQLVDAMEQSSIATPDRISIGVDENNGQWAVCTRRL